MTATVILIRHGEAEGNGAHRLIGWSDVALTGAGEAQAEAVAERLAASPIDRLVASDLRRTMQTAAPLAERTGMEIVTDPRVREINNGAWTGLLPQEVDEGWPELWGAYTSGVDVDRPDGERWADVRSRVIEAVSGYLDDGGTTVIFSHGGPLVISAAWASGIDLRGNVFRGRFAAAENASMCTIVDGPRLLGYNDIGHLRALPHVDVPFDRVPESPGHAVASDT